jgi:hypothetical protein
MPNERKETTKCQHYQRDYIGVEAVGIFYVVKRYRCKECLKEFCEVERI